MKGWHGLVAVVVVLLGVSAVGCTVSDRVASVNSGDTAAVEGTWRYVSGSFQGQQIPTVSGYPVTLTIEAEGFSGIATCNRYAGQLRDSASPEWRVGQMSATEINCAHAAEVSAIGYFEALRAALSIAVTEEGDLRLFGAGADLRFTPVRVTSNDGGHSACPAEPHDLRSSFTKAFERVEFNAVRLCRYRSFDDGSGGRRRSMTVTVGHPQCLGLDFGGRHWTTPTALIPQLDAWLAGSR